MTATGATIRDAHFDDIPRILELYLQLSESGSHPESELRTVTDQHRAALERITGDPDTHLFVLEDSGRVVGTYVLYILQNLSRGGRPFAIVENVVIDDSLRGGGHGRLMMDHAARLARAAGCYKVALSSNNKRAPAHAFYEAIGFSQSHQGFTRYADAYETGP